MVILIFAALAASTPPVDGSASVAPPKAIVRPGLVLRPDLEAVYKVYPPKAESEQLDGSATLHCRVMLDGRLADCTADQDKPSGYGFAEAALKLAPSFQLTPQTENGQAVDTGKVNLRIEFEAKPTPPKLLVRATEADLNAVWPKAAMKQGIGGWALLSCHVTERGTLQLCTVEKETPSAAGFGAAATALTPQFLLKPAQLRGQPVAYDDYKLRINWESLNGLNRSQGLPMGETVYAVAPWASAPTRAEFAAAYPSEARAKGLAGKVSMRCKVSKVGALTGCELGNERPQGQGFRAAAKGLVESFKVDLAMAPKDILKSNIDLNFDFDPVLLKPISDQAPVSSSVVEFFALPTAAELRAAFPKQALAANIQSGSASLLCDISASGQLGNCLATSETPKGLGFAEAALRLGNTIRLNPWTKLGQPLVGGKLTLPFKFDMPLEGHKSGE